MIGNTTLPVSNEAKCLWYTWTQSLSASNMVARRAFFASGSIGAFQGALCGCEHCYLTDTSINMLDKFIGELSKRILNQPINSAIIQQPLLCMGWQSIRALRKAGFLHWITSDTPISEQRLGQQTLQAWQMIPAQSYSSKNVRNSMTISEPVLLPVYRSITMISVPVKQVEIFKTESWLFS